MSTDPHPLLCAWCHRVRSTSGRWEEADPRDLDPAAATHGICPECLAQETRAARAACAALDCP